MLPDREILHMNDRQVSAIAALLAEGRDGALQRERTAYAAIAGEFGDRMVLYAAGALGRRTLKGLRKVGIEPLAFCDNAKAIQGTMRDGLEVLSPEEAARRYGDNAVFVITVWRSTPDDRFQDRIRRLQALGCKVVTSFGPLYWRFPDLFLPFFPADLPHRVHEQAEAVLAAGDIWADERSRVEYLAQLRWRLTMDFDMSDPAPEPIYFPEDIYKLTPDETFVDCGAYDGDTLKDFLARTGGAYAKIFAYEPDPANFAALCAYAATTPRPERIHAEACCVGARNGVVAFSALGNDNSVTGVGEGTMPCIALDEALRDEAPTLIKMDIEGYELEALEGLRTTIARHRPKLAISAYHIQDHLWKIPLLIRSLYPGYRLHLRAHLRDFYDLVCYAVP
jgi:FkbM family methyltransferase